MTENKCGINQPINNNKKINDPQPTKLTITFVCALISRSVELLTYFYVLNLVRNKY
jgi:hypothetical protein